MNANQSALCHAPGASTSLPTTGSARLLGGILRTQSCEPRAQRVQKCQAPPLLLRIVCSRTLARRRTKDLWDRFCPRVVTKLALLKVLVVFGCVASVTGDAKTQARLSQAGWTITADGAAEGITIEHERLGVVITGADLNTHAGRQTRRMRDWSLEEKSPDRLLIKTAKPPSVWVFGLETNRLRIECTLHNAVFVGQVPASNQRIPARLLDAAGVPVEWTGTDEVANGYGGLMTRHQSFLPRQNPECMYFALGQVSAPIFHALFDRKSDTATEFGEGALLRRDQRDADLLELVLPVAGISQIRVFPDYFTKTLGLPFYVPFDDSHFPRPPTTWSTWTSYYSEVTEAAVVRNTDWLAEHLKPYGFEYVQLDDGYDRGLRQGHFWIDHWDQAKFPHGPQWLAQYIKSKGLHPGLWLVPNAYAGAVETHPEWYLRDKQGRVILDYRTPALDSTNPEVLAFLRRLFTTLDGWGFDYYKFDGEHALPQYIPAVDCSKLHDPSLDPIIAYRNRLQVIREVIGPSTFVEGCPAGTPLNGIGYFNSYFNGQDVYNNWQGMYNLFSSINANVFLNHLVVYLMPGEGMEVGPWMSADAASHRRVREVVETARTREDPVTGIGATAAEARSMVSFVALSGVVYPLASVLPELPPDRVQLLKCTLPTQTILPLDLFSRGTDARWSTFKRIRPDEYMHNYPEILDLKVSAKSGIYDVVALPNWRSWPAVKVVAFAEKLGLDAGARYVAFDFWNQRLLGVFQDQMEVNVEPHDTRVILLHPFLNRPQLIGTSRHITGVESILNLSWEASSQKLHGSSASVAGDDYSLFVYVPEDLLVAKTRATLASGGPIPLSEERTGNLLQLRFTGQSEVVNWQIDVVAKAKK